MSGPLYPHGTPTGYRHHRCRCDDCRAAHARQVRDWQLTVQAEGREPAEHGTVSAYTNYRCRCEPCVSAHRAYLRDYYARQKAATS